MARITAQTHATLDGVIESPPEALLPYMSDEGRQATLELAEAADALLLGRTTWQQLAHAWRDQTGPMADRFNSMAELREDNNATAGNRLVVGSGPDFVITAVSTAPGAMPGSMVTVSATVCNQGTSGAGAPPVEAFFSKDTTITGSDFFLPVFGSTSPSTRTEERSDSAFFRREKTAISFAALDRPIATSTHAKYAPTSGFHDQSRRRVGTP